MLEAAGAEDGEGAFVHKVMPDAPAERAGLRIEDVIRKVNGKKIKDSSDLVNNISAHSPGESVDLEVLRNDRTITLAVTLAARPALDQQRAPRRRPREVLGMRVRSLTPQMIEQRGLDEGQQGVIISEIKPGGSADDALLRPGDIIAKVDRAPVNSEEQFHRLVEERGDPGKWLLIHIIRGDEDARAAAIRVPRK